jgi:hypothetical protein
MKFRQHLEINFFADTVLYFTKQKLVGKKKKCYFNLQGRKVKSCTLMIEAVGSPETLLSYTRMHCDIFQKNIIFMRAWEQQIP